MGFAKIAEEIFGSSIMEESPITRLVWIFLLASATKEGEVDQTHQALARRFNLPLADVREAIQDLEAPDPISRSPAEEGRRLVRLEGDRAWGWRIVNYELYRNARNAEERRAYKTQHQAEKRAERACPQVSTGVHSCPQVDNVDRGGPMQKQMQSAEAEADAENTERAASPPVSVPKEWRNLGLTGVECQDLKSLVGRPGQINPEAVRSAKVTDEMAMRLERLHHLAVLLHVSGDYTESDTSMELWMAWRVKARGKARPRLPAGSDKDWRNEVQTLRKLHERPMERRAAIAAGELQGWRGFDWTWLEERRS